MLVYTKFQGCRSVVSGEEDCDQDRLNTIFFSLRLLEATCEIWLQLAQWFQRRSRLKLWTDDGRTDDEVRQW